MGTYTGTSGADKIVPGSISTGVVADPLGTTPSNADDKIYGKDGNDLLNGGGGIDIIDGGRDNDTVYGGSGNDTLYGSYGQDRLYGQGGNDKIGGGGDADKLYGNGGNDDLDGDSGDDVLYGHSGNDVLYGDRDNDKLYGGDGNDDLDGGSGNDILNGGLGFDLLRGNSGYDVFDFDSVSDSLVGSRDIVNGFYNPGDESGDKFDLRTIDANTTVAGNQAFTFVGTSPLSGAGQVHIVDVSGKSYSLLQADVNGGGVDFEVQIEDGFDKAADYSKFDFFL